MSADVPRRNARRGGRLAWIAAIVALYAGIVGEYSQTSRSAEMSDPVRITSSFEVKHASAVLKQVAKLFGSGFVRKDAEALAKDLDTLPPDQARMWQYTVLYKGVSYPLQVRALLDDLGMLDLDFSTTAVLAPAVRRAVDDYLNARGL